jgi:hypothetical protein
MLKKQAVDLALLPPAARGAFLKNRPPGLPEKLFIVVPS